MLSQYKIQVGVLAAVAALSCAGSVFAARPVQQGDITYITGGIGDGETEAIKGSGGEYNLHITNSEKDGSYTAGEQFLIQGRNGGHELKVGNAGPLLYAKLPPGEYVVHATYKGAQQTKDVSVGKGAADVHLIWPQND